MSNIGSSLPPSQNSQMAQEIKKDQTTPIFDQKHELWGAIISGNVPTANGGIKLSGHNDKFRFSVEIDEKSTKAFRLLLRPVGADLSEAYERVMTPADIGALTTVLAESHDGIRAPQKTEREMLVCARAASRFVDDGRRTHKMIHQVLALQGKNDRPSSAQTEHKMLTSARNMSRFGDGGRGTHEMLNQVLTTRGKSRIRSALKVISDPETWSSGPVQTSSVLEGKSVLALRLNNEA